MVPKVNKEDIVEIDGKRFVVQTGGKLSPVKLTTAQLLADRSHLFLAMHNDKNRAVVTIGDNVRLAKRINDGHLKLDTMVPLYAEGDNIAHVYHITDDGAVTALPNEYNVDLSALYTKLILKDKPAPVDDPLNTGTISAGALAARERRNLVGQTVTLLISSRLQPGKYKVQGVDQDSIPLLLDGNRQHGWCAKEDILIDPAAPQAEATPEKTTIIDLANRDGEKAVGRKYVAKTSDGSVSSGDVLEITRYDPGDNRMPYKAQKQSGSFIWLRGDLVVELVVNRKDKKVKKSAVSLVGETKTAQEWINVFGGDIVDKKFRVSGDQKLEHEQFKKDERVKALGYDASSSPLKLHSDRQNDWWWVAKGFKLTLQAD